MVEILLYVATVVLWGTSWLAVKLQLGVVAPEVSVLYRFVGATVVMFALCAVLRRPMRFSAREHAFMALQGLCVFSCNYMLIYVATQYLTSGLVAVVFSTISIITIIEGALFFRFPIRPRVALGAVLGIAGLVFVFRPEFAGFGLDSNGLRGLALAFAGSTCAATGMLVSARNQRAGLPVFQTNAYGMAYGTACLALVCLGRGLPFALDTSTVYVASLLYLAVPCTVLAFWAYLTLVGRIGADRAAYSSVLFPLVALTLSTVVEGYQWTVSAAIGVALVLAGNLIVVRSKAGAAARTPTR